MLDRRGRRRARAPRPTCSCTSRSSSWAAATRRARSTSPARATCSRGRAQARQAARLHVVGRRLRLPRRQPAAADRGRASRAAPSASTTRPRRPSSRRRCDEESAAGLEVYVLRPCIVAGPGRADARCASSRARPARAGRPPCCPTRARRSSSSTTTTWPARSSPRRAARGAPGAYNLAGDGTITLGDLARALGWLLVPGPAHRCSAAPRSAPRCRSCPRSRSGSTPAACRW